MNEQLIGNHDETALERGTVSRSRCIPIGGKTSPTAPINYPDARRDGEIILNGTIDLHKQQHRANTRYHSRSLTLRREEPSSADHAKKGLLSVR